MDQEQNEGGSLFARCQEVRVPQRDRTRVGIFHELPPTLTSDQTSASSGSFDSCWIVLDRGVTEARKRFTGTGSKYKVPLKPKPSDSEIDYLDST